MKRLLCITPFFLLLLVGSSNAQEQASGGKVFWRGNVDNKVHLTIRGTTLEQKTVEGQENPAGAYSFTMPLPDTAVTVGANVKEGRNKRVTIVQQPSSENRFTAIVEVVDDKGGSSEYILEIFWR